MTDTSVRRPPASPVIEPIDLRLADVGRRERARRAVHIAGVLGRRLGPVPLRWAAGRGRRGVRSLIGTPLRDSVFDLGVAFIKLAQLLASSPSLAGEVLADSLRDVLDKGPAVPFDDLRRVVERDLGRPLDAVFASFEETPVAAASLAVVHRATLVDGTPVAVKVLRPAARSTVRVDLAIVAPLVHWLARQFPIAGVPALPEAIDGIVEQLSEELDLRNEARVMAWFAAVVDYMDVPSVRVPAAHPEASGPNVLTMEFVEGSSIDDLDALAAADVDAGASIRALIEAWFAVALCTGTFHGDMHAGNLLLGNDGDVILLDWGIVGRLPAASRRFFRRSLEGALGDESAWPDVRDHMLESFGADTLDQVGITEDQFMALVRAQTMLIMTMPFSQLDLRMLMPAASLPAEEAAPPPRRPSEWFRVLRDQRRAVRDSGVGAAVPSQARGEFLLIKQLVFFERYGKMFLGDQPLIYDPEVYRSLLALPVVEEDG